jgi:peptide/nickel transport system permease protein
MRLRVARVGRLARRKPMGFVGVVIVIVLVLMAVFADSIARHHPDQVRAAQRLKAPSQAHWFGTDDFGRDVFSRVAHGARVSLKIGIAAVLVGTTVGALIGLISGYLGGRFDLIVQRVMDALMAFPTLVLALAVVAALGASLRNVIIAVSLTLIPAANRLVRSVALSVRETSFVMAARASGATQGRVVFRHVLPNCLAPYLVIATANLGSAIVAEASLGFLGLGVPPPTPAWGSMLSGATQSFLFRAPWMAIYPGLAISLAVFGFNMLGDAVRDLLDPKLKGR